MNTLNSINHHDRTLDMAQLIFSIGESKQNGVLDGRRTTVGRAADNVIVVDDATVSGHHAEIFQEKGVLLLKDLDSSNGTKVNGRRISQAKLVDCDQIIFGSVVCVLDNSPLKRRHLGERSTAYLVVVGIAALCVGVALVATHFRNRPIATSSRAVATSIAIPEHKQQKILTEPKVSNETKTRIFAFLEKASKLEAMTKQGVSYAAFRDQLAEIKSSWDTLQLSGWPGGWDEEKWNLEASITGWDYALRIWTDKIENGESHLVDFEVKTAAKYGDQLEGYAKSVASKTHNDEILSQFNLVYNRPIPSLIYLDKDNTIPWCFAAGSVSLERAKSEIRERLQ